MQIPIKRTVERMPGGMMVIPLLAGCIIATFAPDLPKFFGSFTAALFSGALPILAVFYVCMGSTIGFGDPDTLRNAYRFLKEIRISHE